MTRSETARRKIARLFVAGFEGTQPEGEIRKLIRWGLGGVILFDRNLPDQQTALELNRQLLELAGDRPLIVCLDQEGGRVQNLPPPWLRLPAMRNLGRAGSELCRRAGKQLGLELAAGGFHLNLAPVMDLDTNPANPIIGNRSFGSHPQEVSRLALALASGLQEGGVGACAKHFPGHGDTSSDSHLTLPEVTADRERLDRLELVPFRLAAEAGVAGILMAHLRVPALDRQTTSLSPVVYGVLRREIGFAGLVLTDDLEMRAVADHPGVLPAARQALAAGADGALICSQPHLAGQAIEECLRELEANRLETGSIDAAVARWDEFARVYGAPHRRPDPGRLSWLFKSPERAELERRLDELSPE